MNETDALKETIATIAALQREGIDFWAYASDSQLKTLSHFLDRCPRWAHMSINQFNDGIRSGLVSREVCSDYAKIAQFYRPGTVIVIGSGIAYVGEK